MLLNTNFSTQAQKVFHKKVLGGINQVTEAWQELVSLIQKPWTTLIQQENVSQIKLHQKLRSTRIHV